MSELKYLVERGFVKDCTNFEKLERYIKEGSLTLYCGFDLTGQSLHVGHMALLMALRYFLKLHCKIIIVLGGGTTKIGDPCGKNAMRPILNVEQILSNRALIMNNIVQILDSKSDKQYVNDSSEIMWKSADDRIVILDNDYWLRDLLYVDFLRKFGRHFSVNRMLTMDTMRSRLDRNEPLSFLEMNYVVMQAYDFLHLNKNYDCIMQIGGSDQWGNIVHGVDLVNRNIINSARQTIGLTVPLIVRSNGQKMGKSESGAIWITSGMLSSYDYFQYFRNINDSDVKKCLNIFTDLSHEQISSCMKNDINEAKEILAFEATKICHGDIEANKVLKSIRHVLVNKNVDLENIVLCSRSDMTLIDILIEIKSATSRGSAKRMIDCGGVKMNGIKVKCENITDINISSTIVIVSEKTVINRDVLTLILMESDVHYKNLPNDMFQISIGKKKHITIKLK